MRASRGDGKVYTPQVVVDGLTHVNGANEAAIEMAMRKAAKRLQDVRLPVSMRADGDTLIIDVGAAPEDSDRRAATVWLAIAKEVETVKVARGENRGRDISYHHPVRELSPIGMWHGEPMTLRLPLKDLEDHGRRLPVRAAASGGFRADPRRRRVRAQIAPAPRV